MSDPTLTIDTMNESIVCPNHNGSFDCNPFCRLCEGNQETTLSELIEQSSTVAFDGCHKIYLNMDSAQTDKMISYGYSNMIGGTTWEKEDAVWRWYEDSCSLRFIDAVFTNDDDTDKFVTVVAQFFGEDEDVTD